MTISTCPFLALLALLLVGGCGGEEAERVESAQTFHERDSAGIVVVEARSLMWNDSTRWRIDPEPFLQIGVGAEGAEEEQFANISGLHRLPGGSIAVVDSWIPAVIFFDSAGTFLGRAGREGTGPGEFPPFTPARSVTCGADTVYVVVRQQVSAFVPPGRHSRSFSLNPSARVLGCDGRRFVAYRAYGEWSASTPGLATDSALLVWYDRTGSMGAPIDTLPLQDNVWSIGGPHGGSGYMRAPFGRTLSVAATREGFATGFAEDWQVQIRDASGRVTRLHRTVGMLESITAADLDRFREYVLNPWRGNESERSRIEEYLASLEGDDRPSFAELQLDPAGNIWARRYDHLDAVAFFDHSDIIPSGERPTLDEPRRWMVIDKDGAFLGPVDIPRDLVIHQIGDGWVLGVWRDELDIPYIRMYRIVKP